MMGSMRTFVTDRHTDRADYIGPAGRQGGSNKLLIKPIYTMYIRSSSRQQKTQIGGGVLKEFERSISYFIVSC